MRCLEGVKQLVMVREGMRLVVSGQLPKVEAIEARREQDSASRRSSLSVAAHFLSTQVNESDAP